MDYAEIYPKCSFGIMIVSLILCLLVIYLSFRIYTVNQRRDYTWIMGFNAFIDIVYSMVFGILAPRAISADQDFFLTIENSYLLDMPPFFLHLSIFSISIMSLAVGPCNTVHFYYRYSMLCKDHIWTKWKYFIVYTTILLYIIINAVFFHMSGSGETAESWRVLEEELPQGAVLPRHFVVRQNNPIFMVCLVNCQLIFTAEYGVMIFCGVRIIRKMREKLATAASSTKRAQKYVITVMMLQAIYPLLLYFIPIMYITSMLAYGFKFNDISYLSVTCIQLLSTLNSMSVLTLIPAYRRALMHGKNLALVLTTASDSR